MRAPARHDGGRDMAPGTAPSFPAGRSAPRDVLAPMNQPASERPAALQRELDPAGQPVLAEFQEALNPTRPSRAGSRRRLSWPTRPAAKKALLVAALLQAASGVCRGRGPGRSAWWQGPSWPPHRHCRRPRQPSGRRGARDVASREGRIVRHHEPHGLLPAGAALRFRTGWAYAGMSPTLAVSAATTPFSRCRNSLSAR